MFYFLKDQSGSLFAYSLSRLTLGLKPVTISALVLPDNYSGSVPCCARLVWINLTFLCVWFFVVVVVGFFFLGGVFYLFMYIYKCLLKISLFLNYY